MTHEIIMQMFGMSEWTQEKRKCSGNAAMEIHWRTKQCGETKCTCAVQLFFGFCHCHCNIDRYSMCGYLENGRYDNFFFAYRINELPACPPDLHCFKPIVYSKNNSFFSRFDSFSWIYWFAVTTTVILLNTKTTATTSNVNETININFFYLCFAYVYHITSRKSSFQISTSIVLRCSSASIY